MEKIQTNQRKRIEDLFKLLKQRLNMKEIHKYTPKSVERTVYLNVFLETLIISQGFKIYALSENSLPTGLRDSRPIQSMQMHFCMTMKR